MCIRDRPTKEVFEEEFDVMDYGVSVQNIMRYLRAQTNEVNILILDACRDNPFESNWNTTRSLKGGGLAKIPAPTGSLIAFSTDSGQTAPDGDGENSPYVAELKKHLLTPGLKLEELFKRVRAGVKKRTLNKNQPQIPWENSSLVGDFFFKPADISISVIPKIDAPPNSSGLQLDPLIKQAETQEKAKQEPQHCEAECPRGARRRRREALERGLEERRLELALALRLEHPCWAVMMDGEDKVRDDKVEDDA